MFSFVEILGFVIVKKIGRAFRFRIHQDNDVAAIDRRSDQFHWSVLVRFEFFKVNLLSGIKDIDRSFLKYMNYSVRTAPCTHQLGRAFLWHVAAKDPHQNADLICAHADVTIVLQLLTELGLVRGTAYQVMNLLMASQYLIHIRFM